MATVQPTPAKTAAKIDLRKEVSLTRQKRIAVTFKVMVAILGSLFALYPIVYIVSSSLNPVNTLTQVIPTQVSGDNYSKIATDPQYPIFLWLWNSIKVSSISTFIIVILTAFASYAFSRLRWAGRRIGLLSILLIQLFPNTLAIVALYLMLVQVGSIIPWLGLDSHGGLILVYCGGALGANTWLMKGFFDTIPRELDESASIDGASQTETFFLILLPLLRPILAVIAILVFIGTYADYILARVILTSKDNYTLAVGMQLLVDQQQSKNWGPFAAAAIVGAAPIVIVFLVLQKQLVGGLTSGAVKG